VLQNLQRTENRQTGQVLVGRNNMATIQIQLRIGVAGREVSNENGDISW
jgi:hypothetical protein